MSFSQREADRPRRRSRAVQHRRCAAPDIIVRRSHLGSPRTRRRRPASNCSWIRRTSSSSCWSSRSCRTVRDPSTSMSQPRPRADSPTWTARGDQARPPAARTVRRRDEHPHAPLERSTCSPGRLGQPCRRRGSGPGGASTSRTPWSAGPRASASRRWRCSCGSGTSARPRSSSSTRPTTPRTRGRCCTTATRSSYVDGANEKILDGTTTGIWKDDPSMVVHPEVGKWLIALGEKAFGMDPFGWRISAAVAGALMVLVMCRLARRMTGSTALGCTAGLLLSLDGLHFVLSRLALLDIFLALFMLCAVTCLVADRDWYRAKLARLQPEPVTDPASWGPVRRAALPALAAGQRGLLGPGRRDEVDRALPDGGLRGDGLALERRGPSLVRRAGLAALVRRRDGIPAFVPSCCWPGSSTRRRGPAGWCTRTSTRTPTPRRSTPASAVRALRPRRQVARGPDTTDDRWPTAMQPDRSGPGELCQSLRSLANYHQDLSPSTRTSCPAATHFYASKPSGLAAHQQTGERRRRPGHQARRAGLRRARPAAPACARCCSSAPR